MFANAISVSATDITTSVDEKTKIAYDYSTDFLTSYYNSVDTYSPIITESFFADGWLADYVDSKIEAKQCKSIVYGKDDIENYKLEFNLLNSSVGENIVTLDIQSIASFNYKNADVDSGYSETCTISVSVDDGIFIKEWFTHCDEYDAELICDKASGVSAISALDIDKKIEISKKQQQKNASIKLYYENFKAENELCALQQLNKIDNSSIATNSLRTSNSLNKENISAWARNNCNKVLPTSGNSNYVPQYYDFYTISSTSYDCTNFVSHAILAGGAVMHDTGSGGISSTGWYYRDTENRSVSWSGVSYLYNFLTTNTTKGPYGMHMAYSSVYAPTGFPYNYGDLMQFKSESTWMHSAVITGFANITSTTLEPLICGRASASSYQYNLRQSEKYPGEERRIIKLNGYYS